MMDGTEGDVTVLVVDDEEDLAGLYTAFLEAEYDVRTATSGSEALEKIDDAVDVVLLDRRMPGMSGDEMLAEVRDRVPDVQVAMLTAVEPDEAIVDMPFDDYKVKPVERSELLGVVETLLKRATYDEHSQEFFALASKKASLEIAGNDGTEEYDQLVAHMNEVREDVDAMLDDMSARALLENLVGDHS